MAQNNEDVLWAEYESGFLLVMDFCRIMCKKVASLFSAMLENQSCFVRMIPDYVNEDSGKIMM